MEITKETSLSPPFQVRYKSVSSPFPIMGENGTYMGFAWESYGNCKGIGGIKFSQTNYWWLL
jgi:hypothetical protein